LLLFFASIFLVQYESALSDQGWKLIFFNSEMSINLYDA